jgi:peptidoglycan/xylan/chitin deacetylase (PgdA/CDA1 family)
VTKRIENSRARGVSSKAAGIPLILMYHSVSPYQCDPYRITVSPARFEQQMRWLRRLGLTAVSVRGLLEARHLGGGRRLVGLTFDDGYADFAEYALPVLARYGFTATLFVVAGRLGGDNAWDPDGPRKALLTTDQVLQMANAGIEIGSHGLGHVSLPAVTDVELAAETATSRDILRRITGQDVAGFCYPFGHADRRVIGTVQDAGYDYACTVQSAADAGRHALPRTYIGDADSPPRVLAKGMRHWLTWSYRGPGAERLSHAVAIVLGRRSKRAGSG